MRSGKSLLDLPLRDLVDVGFRLMTIWYSQDAAQIEQVEKVIKFFRDRETEFETGELVLPGWAAIGDAAARATPQPPPTL